MKTTKAFRKQLIIALVIFICSIALMSAIYILGNKPEVYINPGIVVSTPSPVANPVQPISSGISSRSNGTYNPTFSSSYHATRHTQSAPMIPMRGLYTTSSAQVHSVGGGGGGGNTGIYTTSGSSSSRGITVSGGGSVAMPATNFLAMASTRQMAEPEAQEAPMMAQLAESPRRISGPPNPGGDIPSEHQLTEQPVGTPLVLALFALLYVGYIQIRKRQKRA